MNQEQQGQHKEPKDHKKQHDQYLNHKANSQQHDDMVATGHEFTGGCSFNHKNDCTLAPTTYEYVNQQCCCFNMRKIMRAVTQYYDHHFETTGIRSTQFTLLVELASTSAKTLTEIAEDLVMDRTTLTRNLKPLAKMDLIATVNTLDKRSKAYTLTNKGQELVKTCIPLWQKAQDLVMQSMGAENYQQVIHKLEHLINILSLQK